MLKLIFLAFIYLLVVFYARASSSSAPAATDTPSSSREKLITSIIKSLGDSNTEYYKLMPSFVTQHRLNVNTDYGITDFTRELRRADINVKPSHAEIIYAPFCNYQVYLRRKESYDRLIGITDISDVTAYKQQMANLIWHFYIDEGVISNEADLKNLISRRLPEITADMIPPSLYQQYDKYMKNKIYEKVRDDLLEEIKKNPTASIEKYEDLISKFKQSFEIGARTFTVLAEFKTYVEVKLSNFDNPVGSLKTIWDTYEKYDKYSNCLSKRNYALNLLGKGDNTPQYSTIRSAMMDFKTKCQLTTTYDDATSFWEAIKETDPTISETKAKFLFYYYKIFLNLLNKENAKNNLNADIALKKASPTRNIDSVLLAFKNAFDLPLDKVNAEDMNKYLSEIKTTVTEEVNGADILTEYNLYVERKNAEDKVLKLHSVIEKRSNIKSYELKTEMEAFISACKFAKNQIFKIKNSFLNHVKKAYAGFDDRKSSLIEPKYHEFVNYKRRIENRDSILELLKGNTKFSIRQNINLLNDFKDLHYPTDGGVPEFEAFKNHLKDMDNVPEDDSRLLYLIYPNYVLYKNKEITRADFVKKHHTDAEAYIYALRVEALKFIKEHYFDLDKTFDKEKFTEYLNDQDIEIKDLRVKDILYSRYVEYLKYHRVVENRKKVISMITKERKLSEMKSTIKAIVDDLSITLEQINDKEALKTFVINRDPEIPLESQDNYIQIIIQYLELIERLPKKESVLEYVYLNPKPKALELESLMKPFIRYFNFGYQEFTSSNTLLAHLQTQQDDISEEESRILFKYYQMFTITNNRRNIRNNLFEFLEKELNPPVSKLFPMVELLVSAYGLTHNSFSSIDEFRLMVQIIDDTFDEKYIKAIYDPIVGYLQFVDRVSKRKALIGFKARRTEASVLRLGSYIDPVIESYQVSYDILSGLEIFTNHINQLDYTMSDEEIENLYNTIYNHVLIMDRIKIKDTSLETIKHYSFGEDNSNVINMMTLLVDIYQIAGKKITNTESLFHMLSEKDPTVTKEEAKTIYPHYVIYMESANRRILRSSLLGYIRNIPNPTFKEFRQYMNPYIKSHNLMLHELYKFELFYFKNKAIDKSITNEEIESLWMAVQIFIKYDEFVEDKTSVLSHNDVIYDEDFVQPSGLGGIIFEFLRYFGAYPHYIPSDVSLSELSDTQKSFGKTYRFLTGIEYFRVRDAKVSSNNS